jgi:hypothetical protein
VIDNKASEQIRQDGEALRRSGMDGDHVRKVQDNARRLTDAGMERRERDAQRKR